MTGKSLRKVILYIAESLDGYIATDNDELGFLAVVRIPGEDYGYKEFTRTVDTVIMGRKTYDKVLSFGGDFPHKDKKCFVLSKTRTGKDDHVEFYEGDIAELITMLRQTEGKDIYVDGGSGLVFELMKKNLIDRFVISIIPYLLGGGIPLFKADRPEQELKLTASKVFSSGLVQLTYETIK